MVPHRIAIHDVDAAMHGGELVARWHPRERRRGGLTGEAAARENENDY
jgi:hypothetical protein